MKLAFITRRARLFWVDCLILVTLTVLFAARYFHRHFILQGDVNLQLYLHHYRDLFQSNWDPYTLGYLGWYPIAGLYFPLNQFMHAMLSHLEPVMATLIGLQINATISLALVAISTYGFLRYIALSRYASLCGACVIFTGFHIQSGFRELDVFYLHSMMMIAPALICMLQANRTQHVVWALASGVLIGLSILGGSNVPMFMSLPFFLLIPCIDHPLKEALRPRRLLRNLSYLCVACLCGLLIGAVVVIPSFIYTPLTMRSEALSFDTLRGLRLDYTIMSSLYQVWWQPNGYFNHETDYFLGAPILFLLCLGLTAKGRRPGRLFMSVIMITGFAIIHINYLPTLLQQGFQFLMSLQSIRFPARFSLVMILPIATFVGLGFDRLIRIAKNQEPLNIFAKILLLAVGCSAIVGFFFTQNLLAVEQETSLLIVMNLTLVFAGLVWWIVLQKEIKRLEVYGLIALVFLIYIAARPDIPTRYDNETPYEPKAVGTEIKRIYVDEKRLVQPLLDTKEPFRIMLFRNPRHEKRQSYTGPLWGAEYAYDPSFDPATPRGLFYHLWLAYDHRHNLLNATSPLLDLYNVRYIWMQTYKGSKLSKTTVANMYENTNVFPRYFLTHGVRTFSDLTSLWDGLGNARSEDLRHSIYLVETGPPTLLPKHAAPNEGIKILDHTPTHIRLQATLGMSGHLVVSNLWFPAWRVRVNGEDQELLRAYGAFQAVALPEGTHLVELSFEDHVTRHSRTFSLFSFLGIISILILMLLRRRDSNHVKL